jgi:Na+(H+)/acetate symporter ActP
MTKACKLVLAVRGRDIGVFGATREGLGIAQRAASKAARGIGHPPATVTQVCAGAAPEVLVRCTAARWVVSGDRAVAHDVRRRWPAQLPI